MTANELRIGNYVSYHEWDKFTSQVKGIKDDDRFILSTPFGGLLHTSDIEPILLTEEWLDRMGFCKFDKGDYWLRNISGCFPLCIDKATGEIYSKSDYKMEFVHHIQNAFFSLFHFELTIKETVTESEL